MPTTSPPAAKAFSGLEENRPPSLLSGGSDSGMVKKALHFLGRSARPPSRRNLVSFVQVSLFLAIIIVFFAFAGLRWLHNNAQDSIHSLIEGNSEYNRDRISFRQPQLRWKGLAPGLRLPELRIDEHDFGDLSIFIDPLRLLTDFNRALVRIELEDFSGEILFNQTGGLNFKGLRLQPNLGFGNMHQSTSPWLALNLLEVDQLVELKELRLIDPYNDFSTALSDGLLRYAAKDARLQAQAELITDWGAEAEFDMDLAKTQTGLQGHFGVEVSTLDLGEIPTPFLSAFKVHPSGTLDRARFQVAIDGRGNARADLDFPDSSKIFLRHQETGHSSSLEVTAINFNVTRQKGGLLLSSELRLAADPNSSTPPRISGEFSLLAETAGSGTALSAEEARNGGDSEPLRQLGMSLLLPEIGYLQPGTAKISGQYISLPAMQQLSRTILPALEQRLRGLGGISLKEGQLEHWQLRFDERLNPNWSFNGSIEQMSVAIGGAHPGSIEDISAQLKIEPNRARVFVSAEAVKIDFPTVFDKPLLAMATRGLIELQIDATSFKAEIPFWGLYSLDASADFRGEVNFNPERGTEVDIEGEFTLPQLAILESFYPYRAVPEGLSDWLRDAKLRGRADNGTLLLRGPMRSFPFERGEGELRINADVDLEQLRYGADWPFLRGASGKVSLGDGGFEMALPRGFSYITEAPNPSSASAGRTAKVKTQLSDILVDIDNIHGPANFVRASLVASGDTSELLDFARRGPLAEQLGPFVQDAVGVGPVETLIEELVLPLHDNDRLEFKGSLSFSGARVDSKKLSLRIDDIHGRTDFTRDSYKAENLTMRIFGSDFKVEALSDDEAQRRGQTRLKVVAVGLADSAKILKNYHIPGWQRLSGETMWRAVFDIHKTPRDASPRVRLTATSNLKGLSVNLPKPLTKSIFRGVPFQLDMLLDNAGEDRSLEAKYGDLLSLRMVHDANNMNINRGHAHFGPATSLTLPRGQVFRITGSMEELDADGWLDFIDEVAALPAPPVKPPQVPTRMNAWPYSVENLKAEKIEYLGFKWRGLKADVETQGRYYRSKFSAEQAGGSAEIPRDAKFGLPVFARLNYLDFDDLEPIKKESEPPAEVPPLDVKIDELVFQGFFIENFDVNLVPASNGMATHRLSFSNRGLKATGQGSWVQASKRGGGAAHDSSRISLNLELNDLGRAWYGMTGDGDVFEDGKGRSLIQLSWDDNLFAPEFSEVVGSINVNAESGRLLFINPVAAKLLNLLLVTQWFKGLDGNAGLLFSKLEANMILRDSSLHQQRTQISSDLAFIDLQGNANVTEETFDLKALVSPPIAAALPATGLLLGGVPGLLGGFLLQGLSKLFSDDSDRSGLLYDVTGSWDDPEFALSGSSGDRRP